MVKMRAEQTDTGTRDWEGACGGTEKALNKNHRHLRKPHSHTLCVSGKWGLILLLGEGRLTGHHHSHKEYAVVQSLSCVRLCDLMDCSTPGFPVLHHLLEFAQIHVHWVSDSIQPSHPLSSPSPPAFNLSQHQVFSNESVLCIRWPKYWSFSVSISPSNEYSGLISFRTDWLDLLAVQGTSPASQFKGISSLALSLFYCLALTAIHDYWKNHSFDYTDLCRQSNISDF